MSKRNADEMEIADSPVFQYVDQSYRTKLNIAIETNDKQLLLKALKSGASVRLNDNNGWTPLHLASKFDRADFMKLMLKKDAEAVNLKTHDGKTPLAICCEVNSYNTLRFLLTQKCIDLNCADNDGASALHIACSRGSFEIVKELVEHGAFINATDFSGYTPLFETVFKNHLEICQYLLSHGADPLIKDNDNGLYPFHYACQNGNLRIVNILLENMKQFPINTTGDDGRTALMISIGSKNFKLIRELLKRGSDANIPDEDGIIALHIATSTGCFDIFKLIYENTSLKTILKYCTLGEIPGRSCGIFQSNKQSLITLAIKVNNLEFLKNILELGLDERILNSPYICSNSPKYFYTPICFLLDNNMVCFTENTVKFLELLIKFGFPLIPTWKDENSPFILDPLTACIFSLDFNNWSFVLDCIKVLLQYQPIIDILNVTESKLFISPMEVSKDVVLLLLQHSDVMEPFDLLLLWVNINNHFSSEHYYTAEDIGCMLIDLTPERSSIFSLFSKTVPMPTPFYNKVTQVPSLSVICRHAIRTQLHRETQNNPSLFRQKLRNLLLPRKVHSFLNYM